HALAAKRLQFATRMRHHYAVAIYAVSTLALNPIGTTVRAQQRSPPVLVTRVIDGDTIDLAGIGRLQLLGIDAPELGRRPYASTQLAREARQRLAGLLSNRWVRLEYEDSNRARSTSRSAYVFLEDGKFVNEWLVREGLARVAGRAGLRRRPELQRAEHEAQSLRLGLWSDPLVNR